MPLRPYFPTTFDFPDKNQREPANDSRTPWGVSRMFRAGAVGFGFAAVLAGAFGVEVAHAQSLSRSKTTVTVNEPDGMGSYTIALSSQPTGNVVVAVASGDTSVATVSPSSLSFTSANWDTRQEVTVTAVDDDLATPAMRTTAITHTASGANFNGVSTQVTVQVVNDDQASFQAGSGAYAINGGEDNQVVMPIWITSEPTGDVTVALSVADETVATVNPASVTFTPANWRDRVDITITGVANDVHDPDHRSTTISFTVSGADYDGKTRPAVSVTVVDDDQRTFRVTSHSFAVSENGGQKTLSMWITTEPTGNVTVTLASQDTSVATVNPTSMTFTPSNWKQQVDVTVTGVDDDIYNNPHRKTQIVVTISGADYDMMTTPPISVTAADDEPVPVTLPEGRAFSYGLRLTLRQGEGSVSLEVTSSEPEVVAIAPETRILTWTEATSGTSLTVRASTVDNDVLGNGFATISHRYTQPRDPDIPVVQGLAITVTDDDIPAVTVAPTDLLVVTGATGTYSVVLDVEPNADVTITASSGNAGVAAVAPGNLTFTPSDWNVAQTVTVTGAGEGSAAISHAASGGGYDGAAIDDVTVTVVDSLKRMDVTTSATHDEITLTWPEVEGAAGYQLEIQGPGVNRTAKTTAERKVWRGLSPSTSYDLRAIPLTGLGQDGFQIPGYTWWEGTETTTAAPGDPGLVFSRTDVPVDEGSTEDYTVALATEPGGEVTVSITGAGRGVGASRTSLEFTTANWSTAQTVTVTAAEDSNTVSETVTLTHTASGGGYDSVTGAVTVRTNDDDTTPTPPGNRPPAVTASCNPCTVVPGGEVSLTAAAADPDGDPLTYTWSAPQGGFLGAASGAAARWRAPEATGTVTIRVVVSDGRGGSAAAVANVEVERPNPPPARNRPPTVTAECDPCTVAPGGEVSLTAAAADPDGDELTYTWSAPQGSFLGAADAATARWRAPDGAGTVTIRVVVSDGRGGSAAAVVNVEVVRPNRRPTVTVSCDPCTVAPGGEVSLTATASDPDGDELTYSWSAPQGGFLGTADAATARWQAPEATGTVTIRIEVSDGRGGSASAEVVVEVVNEPPVFQEPAYAFELRENLDGRQRPVALGLATASDPDGDEVTYALLSGDRERFAIGAQNGAVTYAGPGEDFESEPNRYELTARARDPHGAEAKVPIVVTVTNLNEAPEAQDDEARTAEDQRVTVDVLANDTDPDGDALHVESVSAPEHGTARAVSGGVAYTPEANYHGTDRFTYVVSDGSGGTAEAAVEVVVVSANDAPVTVGTIPDQVLDEGGAEVTVELGRYFHDADGDTLVYRAASSDELVVTVGVSGETLTLTPVEYGSATVRVTGEDPDGMRATQTFGVGVSDRLVRAVVEDTLAALARSHLASARMTLGRRAAAGPGGRTELRVMGRTVPLGLAEAERLMSGGRGYAGRYSNPARLPGLGTFGGGVMGAAAPGGDPGCPMGPGPVAQRDCAGGPGSPGGYAGAGLGPDRWLSGTEFVLAWGQGEAAGEPAHRGRSWQVWGQGDLQTFQGARSAAVGYDGDLRTGYLGLDTWLTDRWLAGVALARSQGSGDWRVGGSSGTLSATLTAVHPYLHWSDGRTSVSALGGGGWGEVENVRRSGRLGTSDLGLGLGLVEVRRRYGAAGGRAEIGLRGDAAWARLATGAGEETIDGHRVGVSQARFGTDVSRPVRMRNGLALAPFVEAHVRRDGGAGQTGTGLELAGGLRAARGRVRVDAQGRMLVLHSAAGYRERGVGVTLSVGSRQQGLSLVLSPRWGDPANGGGRLWQEHVHRGYRGYRGGAQSADWGVDAGAGYAVRLRPDRLLTWFCSYRQSRYGPGLAVGIRIGGSGGRLSHPAPAGNAVYGSAGPGMR